MFARSSRSDRYPMQSRARRCVVAGSGGLLGLLVVALVVAGCDASRPSDGRAGTGVDAAEIADAVAASERLSAADAYEAALAERDPLMQHMLLASVYGRADESNVLELSDVFAADSEHRNGPQARVIGALWGRIDPERGLAETLSWERPLVREFASRELMDAAVAKGRGEELIGFLASLEPEIAPGSYKTGQVALVEALFEGGENEIGLAFIEGARVDAELRSGLIGKGVLAGGRRDAEGVIRWAEERLESGAEQSDTFMELAVFIMRLLTSIDHERGRAWFEEHLAGTRVSDQGLEVLTDSEWARGNPQKAFDYVRSRPTMEPIARGARALAYHWLKNDPETAKRVLLQAANEDARMETVILPLVQYMMVMEVPRSMELAQRIADPGEKHAALKQGLMRWARIDPAAVDAYVERYPVSPDLRRSIAVAKSLAGTKRTRVEDGGGDPADAGDEG